MSSTCTSEFARAFASASMLPQLHALARELPGAYLGDDIECVHKMRVASRRLRTMLALFPSCLPEKRVPSWMKRMRRLTKSLGSARDLDVQRDFVACLHGELTDARLRPGVARLLLRLRQERTRTQTAVQQQLDAFTERGVLQDMIAYCEALGAVASLPNDPALYQHAEAAISMRLAEMRAYDSLINDPTHIADLHACRIAAKRLRYTMEVFAPLFHHQLQRHVKAARAMQDVLGDVHDCDVWLDLLPAFLERERQLAMEYAGHARALTRLRPGIAHVQQDRHAYRAQRYQEFLDLWRVSQHEGLWESLPSILHSHE